MSDVDPQALIADLDDALAEVGAEATLVRLYGTNRTESRVDLKVVLRGYKAEEITGEIQQTDQAFIMSPTEINNKPWPGFHSNEPENIDLRIPRKNDQILASRGKLTVQEADGIWVQGTLVRIEGRVRGN